MTLARQSGESTKKKIVVQAACLAVAVSLRLISSWILNTTLFVDFNAIMPEARDITMVFLAVLGIILTVVALNRPSLFKEQFCTPLSLVLVVVGVGLSVWGVNISSPFILTVGSLVRAGGYLWIFVMMSVSLMQLGIRAAAVTLAVAYVLKYAWMFLVSFLPDDIKVVCYVLIPFMVIALIRRTTLDAFASIGKCDSQANLEVTSPASFVPFTHTLFITILLFQAASGYALAYGSVASLPQLPLLSVLPLMVVAFCVIRAKKMPVDALFQGSALLIVAGYLCVFALAPAHSALGIPWSQVLLTAGADCFSLLSWFVVACLAARNVVGALPMFLFYYAAESAGTVFGANMGHLTNAISANFPSVSLLFVALIVLLFVAYNLVVLKTFSFEATLSQVAPMQSVFVQLGQNTLEGNCSKVVKRYGLTPKEAEIVELLARGRNSQAIQEKLVVSRNTVKTHVKNIYLKLDVHSQQELIDLVEKA